MRCLAPVLALSLLTACVVSVQEEIRLGHEYAAEIDQSLPVVRDPAVQRALDQAVRPVVAAARRQELAWTFRVVNTADVNAFAVPGGHVYLTRGLIERATRYDQLAGVLGHEIGHVDLRHSAEQMEKARAAALGVSLGYILAGREPGRTESTVLNIAATAVFAKFSRDDEREADRAAVGYLTSAGINPEGLVDLFRILEQVSAREPSAIDQFFASHPMATERITDVQRMIAADTAAQRAARTGRRDAAAFATLREAVRALPPPPSPTPKPKPAQ